MKTILIIVLAVLIIGGAFYWYEYRPSQIREQCNNFSELFSPQNVEMNYKFCLRDHGLEK